jgi:hypothetical protein
MTPFIPFFIVTSLYEVFVEGHLSNLFSLWPHCMKYVLSGRPLNNYFILWGHNEKMYEKFHRTPPTQYIFHTVRSQWEKVWKVSSYSTLSIITSYNEVKMRNGMKGIIVLRPLNKYFIQWGHNEKGMKGVIILHHWVDGVRWHLSDLFSLWPHWQKYLLRG